ncbi:hypothetical protein GCM10023087_26000 [Microbacterium rhizosphaerae]
MPHVTIQSPQPDFVVPDGQALHVAGVATGTGGFEPVLVDAVQVSVDGGPAVAATKHVVAHQKVPTVTFSASVAVGDQPGAHTVTVVVTDDNQAHASASVQVLRDISVVVPPPAILIDLEPPFPTTADDPSVQDLVGTVAQTLATQASQLTSAGLLLVGPNVIATQDGSGIPILRLGVWLLDAGFPVQPPAPPQFPLPRLSPPQAVAGFALVPPLRRGHRTGFTDTPFGVRVPETTLQRLADFARVQAGNSDVESITVTLSAPATASTVVSGSHLGISFSIDIEETLSVAPVAGVDPPQSIPHVDSEYSTNVGSFLDWLIGALIPIVGGILVIGSVELAENADQVPGVVTGLLSGLPGRVAVHNTSLPAQAQSQFDFPQVVLDWSAFGVNDDGLEGAGDAIIAERNQAGARLTVAGPGSLNIPHGEFDVDTVYRLQLWQIRPDDGGLTWRFHPPVGTEHTGTADPGVLAEGADVDFDFVLPPHSLQGTFTISATAIETCGTDATKTISATATKSILVRTH